MIVIVVQHSNTGIGILEVQPDSSIHVYTFSIMLMDIQTFPIVTFDIHGVRYHYGADYMKKETRNNTANINKNPPSTVLQ